MRRSYLVASVAVAAACGADREGPLMAALRAAPPAERSAVGRLSVNVRFRPCNTFYIEGMAGADGCSSPPAFAPEWSDLGARISAASERVIDQDALHAAAALDLIAGAVGNSLDRSISFLEMTARLSPESAASLTDLSAAYLERAHRDGDAQSLIAALDAAVRALRLTPDAAAAQFNAAVATYRLGLFDAARSALARFIAIEPKSQWADEARAAMVALGGTPPALTDSGWSGDSAAALVRSHPSDVRTFAWHWLAGWGDSWRRHDEADAARWLDRSRQVGDLLAANGDSAIAWAVTAIDRAGADGRSVIAAAHRNFSDGLAHTRQFQAQRADTAYGAAMVAGDRSPALSAWAAFHHANNLLGLGRAPQAERDLRRLLGTPAFLRDRTLSARAWWTLGVILLRDRRMDEGRGMLERSRVIFAGIGEHEYAASMVSILAEIAGLGNDSRRAYDGYAQALRELQRYPRSVWRHNTLLLMSRAALADGMMAAADVITQEDAAAVALVGRPTAATEVQLARARLALRDHDQAELTAAVNEGRRLAQTLPPGAFRSQLEADLSVVLAQGSDPGATPKALMDSAIASYSAIGNYVKLLDAYGARARVALRSRDAVGAERDFNEASEIYAQRRAEILSPVERSLLAHSARSIVDELTMLRLARGDASGALAARERVRGAGPRSAVDSSRKRATVEYTVVRDTLVAMLVIGGEVRAERTPVEAASVERDVEVAVAALERRAAQDAWLPALERLHELLVAPLMAHGLADAETLTVVADGAIGRVPFAALRDAKAGTWLVERFVLRYASSRPETQRGRLHRGAAKPRRALVVSNPELDRSVFPSLGTLAGANREADAVARVLPGTRLLQGGAVNHASLRDGLAHTELFHFAGHAVFDDARPERSVLAVSSRGLSAAEIASMRLPTLRLVVLSACETDRAPNRAGGGFLGLAESFLAAGAGGVVGSLWRVDDDATAEFMEAFYSELSANWNDPGFALARTQRAMVGQSPAAWAAFRYAGR